MNDPNVYLTLALVALAVLAMLVGACLSGWRGWLALQHEQLAAREPVPAGPSAGSRIEIADLKERIRKLEAIAAGVDL